MSTKMRFRPLSPYFDTSGHRKERVPILNIEQVSRYSRRGIVPRPGHFLSLPQRRIIADPTLCVRAASPKATNPNETTISDRCPDTCVSFLDCQRATLVFLSIQPLFLSIQPHEGVFELHFTSDLNICPFRRIRESDGPSSLGSPDRIAFHRRRILAGRRLCPILLNE